jgi:predicted secreted hydrolase
MAGTLKKLAMSALMAWGGGAMAQDAAPVPAAEPVKAPSADAVRDTWNYYYKAQGQGPVLVEAKLCTEVGKEGPNKFECTAEVPPEGVKANTSVMVWQSYLVPQGDSIEDLMVQTKQGNVVRETKDVKIKGEGWRSRQWTGVRLGKAGDWTVSILRGDQVLKTFNVKVL